MPVDLHSHFFPAELPRTLPDPPVVASRRPDGTLHLRVLDHDFVVPGSLGDPQRQAEDAERQGLDRRVLMVPPFTVLYELDAARGIAWSRQLNEAVAGAASQYPDRLVGFATVPLQDGDAAARELAYAVRELHLGGVEILTSICGRGLDAPEIAPFWAAAAELSVPVFIHPHYVAGADRMASFHLRNLVGNPTETALAGARLLFSGLIDRHPTLKVVLAHGGGALPHLVGRLQHGYRVRPEFRDGAASPAAGIRRLYYDTVVFDPTVLRHLGELVGFDRLVLGSDYPFDMAVTEPVAFVAGAGLAAAHTELVLHSAQRLMADTATGPPPA